MTQQSLDVYFSALERLKKGHPNVVPKGTKITNDAVAVEANCGKGSIKKSRATFYCLIQAIDEAAIEQSKKKNEQKNLLDLARSTANRYRVERDDAIAREISLLSALFDAKKKIALLTGANVLPLRRKETAL